MLNVVMLSGGRLNVVAPLLAESNVCMPLVRHLNLNNNKMTLLKTNTLDYLTRLTIPKIKM
jgi:hypothetical protein